MVKKQPQAHLQLHTLYNLVMLPAQPNNNNNVEYISEIWNIAFKYNQATFIDIDGSALCSQNHWILNNYWNVYSYSILVRRW